MAETKHNTATQCISTGSLFTPDADPQIENQFLRKEEEHEKEKKAGRKNERRALRGKRGRDEFHYKEP